MKKQINFTSKYFLIFVVLVAYALIAYFNYLYPLWQDDGVYSCIWNEDQPITDLWDIVVSQYNHYMTWGGRVMVHGIAQLLLFIGKPAASFINAGAFVLLIYVIYKIATLEKNINWVLFLLIFLFGWLFFPHLPNTIFWITGSANYLWGTLIALSFMFFFAQFFIKSDKSQETKNSKVRVPVFFFLGIIAGWTNENTAVALGVFLVLIIGYLKYTSVKIPWWMYAGLLGAMVGAAFCILAPGNFYRLSLLQETPSLLDRLGEMSGRLIGKKFRWVTLILIVLTALNLIFKLSDKKHTILSGIFAVCAFVGIFAMLASPEFPFRAWFGAVTFMLVSISILLANFKFRNKTLETWRPIGLLVIALGLIIPVALDYTERLPYMKGLHYYSADRDRMIEEAKKAGRKDIVFDTTYSLDYWKYDASDVLEDPEHWKNKMASKGWGVNSVRVSKDAEMVDLKHYYRERKKQEKNKD